MDKVGFCKGPFRKSQKKADQGVFLSLGNPPFYFQPIRNPWAISEVTLPRDQIEVLQSTGQSLMPDGLEKNVSIEEMTDLLRFLKDWRYLDGKTPKG